MHCPKMVRYPPPLVLNFTQAHQSDTPFCDISRDNRAIYASKTSTKEFCDAIATSISRDMRSIAAGPLRNQLFILTFQMFVFFCVDLGGGGSKTPKWQGFQWEG